MSYVVLDGVFDYVPKVTTLQTAQSSVPLPKGAPPRPSTACGVAGGWQWDYAAGLWVCQETNPNRFTNPPGWEWQGGDGKRKPWRWRCRSAETCGSDPNRTRYYDTEGLPSGARGGYRYTPKGQVGPAGPGPRWYNVTQRARSEAPPAPIKAASDTYWARLCAKRGVPEGLVPVCVAMLRERAPVQVPGDIDQVAAEIQAAIARGELTTGAEQGGSKLLLYGGIAAAGLLGALLLRKRR